MMLKKIGDKMKYFVCSDPHGFTTIMKNDLHNAGFEEGNPEHKLIICGDIFDRGEEPVEMYQYLKGLGDQFIFIRGNHEDLFKDAYYEEFKPYGMIGSWHHRHNGTDKTIYKLFNAGLDDEVLGWILDKSIDYFETEHYIFVHGWIPCTEYDEWENPLTIKYQPNWRESDRDKWKYARWLNGMKMWNQGIVESDKTIVCGHWHCGWGNAVYHKENIDDMSLDDQEYFLSDHPFIDDGILALDACTVLNKKVNVVILED